MRLTRLGIGRYNRRDHSKQQTHTHYSRRLADALRIGFVATGWHKNERKTQNDHSSGFSHHSTQRVLLQIAKNYPWLSQEIAGLRAKTCQAKALRVQDRTFQRPETLPFSEGHHQARESC